jgi:hypothetical protein
MNGNEHACVTLTTFLKTTDMQISAVASQEFMTAQEGNMQHLALGSQQRSPH